MSGHSIVTPGPTLRARSQVALHDTELQSAISNLDRRLFTARAVADSAAADKSRAAAIRRETLADLDGWLEQLTASLERVGVIVHHATTPADARRVILDVARREQVSSVIKSKSMATEEIDCNDALEAAGVTVLETDLGEYIVQLAGERPSHIVTPTIHKTLPRITALLSEVAGAPLPEDRAELTQFARTTLRALMLGADMGITGANFACADTGTLALVTNEGNLDYCVTVPRVQVAVVPVEKVIPRFADLSTFLPLLTRSATGQAISNYVTLLTGPRRPGEIDGPESMHVVLLDHNRRSLVGTPYEEMLACIRCGACLNVCPVYRSVSGHAYDSVYPGPMGMILTPLLSAGAEGTDLPFASSLCGACTEACPVEIPLADLLVRLRADLRDGGSPALGSTAGRRTPPTRTHPGEGHPWAASTATLPDRRVRSRSIKRVGYGLWARLWASPRGYRLSTRAARFGAIVVARRVRWHGRRVPKPAPKSFLEARRNPSTRPPS